MTFVEEREGQLKMTPRFAAKVLPFAEQDLPVAFVCFSSPLAWQFRKTTTHQNQVGFI